MGFFVTFVAIFALIAGANCASTNNPALSIKEATEYCEREVPKYCISTTCPLYCSTINSKQAKARCPSECNLERRCKLKPAVGQDDPKNSVLDAQNRDALWACIAEKRDPAGTKTGRRPTPWREIQTESFKKAVGRA